MTHAPRNRAERGMCVRRGVACWLPLETCGHLVRQRGVYAIAQSLLHRWEPVGPEPSHLSAFVVAWPGLARKPCARKRKIEVRRSISVRVDYAAHHRGRCKPVNADLDPGFLTCLAGRARGGFLTGIHDSGDRCPCTVVRSAHQQHLLVTANHRRHARHPQFGLADLLPEFHHEVGDWHAGQVSPPPLAQPVLPRPLIASRRSGKRSCGSRGPTVGTRLVRTSRGGRRRRVRVRSPVGGGCRCGRR